jgi:hypothetical protein
MQTEAPQQVQAQHKQLPSVPRRTWILLPCNDWSRGSMLLCCCTSSRCRTEYIEVQGLIIKVRGPPARLHPALLHPACGCNVPACQQGSPMMGQCYSTAACLLPDHLKGDLHPHLTHCVPAALHQHQQERLLPLAMSGQELNLAIRPPGLSDEEDEDEPPPLRKAGPSSGGSIAGQVGHQLVCSCTHDLPCQLW